MKNSIDVHGVTGIVILAIFVSAITGCKQAAPPAPQPAPMAPAHIYTGPPVIVVGGSILGQSDNGWSQDLQICPGMATNEWCAPNGGSSDFLASYLYDPGINNPKIPSGQGSWTVRITDKNPNNEKAGVELCGNVGCDITKPSDLKYIYTMPSNGSIWKKNSPNQIEYVDKTCSPNGNCERPVNAILSIKGSSDATSTCVAPNLKGCFIGAGAPSFSKR